MSDLPAGVAVIPVRTPTLPPATHTNTWVLGHQALTVVDPASPWPDEQARLADELRALGRPVERLFLTHHHHDHVGGVEALRAALGGVPVVAHPRTAALVADRIDVDEVVLDGEVLQCGGQAWTAHHTPGHAPGHLVLHEPDSGALVAGDMVAGVGTIAIDPREGSLADYLASLEAMRALEPTVLLPAHGPPLRPPETVLSMYIAHRHGRTDQIRDALDRLGARTPVELVPEVYPALPPEVTLLAAAQITTHLVWMAEQGLARRDEERWRLVR